jgi:hypothetical protein
MDSVCRIFVLVGISASSLAFGRPEHNAFLNTPISSVSSLVAEVRKDPQVLKRYERQFDMTEPALIRYFEGLHVQALTEDKRYLVFNVDDDYVIRRRMLHLTKGTLVFADSSNRPVLKCSCGNPMTAAPPAMGENDTALHSVPFGDTVPSTRDSSQPDALDALAEDDTVSLTGEEPTFGEDTLVAETAGDVGRALEIAPAPDAPLVGPGLASSAGQGIGGLGFLPLIGLLGLINTGHSTSPGPPVIFVTPEPATFLPILVGVVGLSVGRRRNRR